MVIAPLLYAYKNVISGVVHALQFYACKNIRVYVVSAPQFYACKNIKAYVVSAPLIYPWKLHANFHKKNINIWALGIFENEILDAHAKNLDLDF